MMKKTPISPPTSRISHGLPIVRPQVGPQVLAVDLHHHERGDGEDGAGDQSFPHRSRRARDVLLQNPAAPDAEHGDGDDGGRNGGGDGLPRLHAQVGVSRAENQRQHEAQPHGFEGHFGWIGGMLRVRHKGGWYHGGQGRGSYWNQPLTHRTFNNLAPWHTRIGSERL